MIILFYLKLEIYFILLINYLKYIKYIYLIVFRDLFKTAADVFTIIYLIYFCVNYALKPP